MPDNSKIIARTSRETGVRKKKVKKIVTDFQNQVEGWMYTVIEDKAEDNEKRRSAFKEHGRTFIYRIYDTQDKLVVGGAGNIILYIAKEIDMSKGEIEVVRTANRLCAEENDCTKHALMDDVLHLYKPEDESTEQ